MYSEILLLLQIVYCVNVKALAVGALLPTTQIKAVRPFQSQVHVKLPNAAFVRPRLSSFRSNLGMAPSAVGNHAENSIAHAIPVVESSLTPSLPASIEQKTISNIETSAYKEGYEPLRSARALPKDVIAEYNPNTPTQRVGSCHMFAIAQVLYSTIKRITGHEISIGSMFADHLLSPYNIGPAKVLQDIKSHALEYHYNSIEQHQGKKMTCDQAPYEGGNFYFDMALLQAFGAALVKNSADYKFVEDAALGLKASRLKLIKNKFMPSNEARAGLEKSVDAILSKSVHADKDKVERALVRKIVQELDFQGIQFDRRYNAMPVDKALKAAKSDLINLLKTSGVTWIAVDHKIFYRQPEQVYEIGTIFPRRATHAIALVGYEAAGDLFLIKDSNQKGLVKMSANRFLVAVKEAYALIK